MEWSCTVYGGDVTSIVFKEFLPDQPELGNLGLIKAENVLPRDDGYSPYYPLNVGAGTIGSAQSVRDAFMSSGVTKGAARVYAYSGDFFIGAVSGPFTTHGGAFTVSASIVDFAQYENLVIAVGDTFDARKHTAGATGAFSTLASSGTAPPASAIGVIGQFVVIGNLGTAGSANELPNYIRWSGIDAPTSWPLPNSATAIAQQAGEQVLPSSGGEVFAIHGGDQHGVVLQKRLVTRMTYVGPPVVFQFDTISNSEGCHFQKGHLRVGNLTYFVSLQGFCRTDGVSIDHIGAGKVDKFFWDSVNVSSSNPVQVGYDYKNDLVYFAYSVSSSNSMDRILIFNPKTRAWSYAVQNMSAMVNGAPNTNALYPMTGIKTAGGESVVGQWVSTAGAAVLETGDFELNDGGRAFVSGIKPNIESSATAPSMTVRLGYRNDLATTPTYTSATSANSATGFADFRVDAKYHRAEVTVTGNFDKAVGVSVKANLTGKR